MKLAFQFYSLNFDVLNYKIFINKFQYSIVSSFIDSGVGLVLSIWFILAVVEQRKQIYAKLTVWVWCGVAYNYRRLLTNCLHGKARELCLANSLTV